MRIIKLGIISAVFFAVFLTLLSFFFPSHVRISKAIDIRSEKNDLVKYINNHEFRYKWYTNADSLAVFGKNSHGKLITEINSPSDDLKVYPIHIVIENGEFVSQRIKEIGWNIIPQQNLDIVTVQWYVDFHLRWYPWEKFSGLLLEKRYGPMMEQGLEKLKKLLEK